MTSLTRHRGTAGFSMLEVVVSSTLFLASLAAVVSAASSFFVSDGNLRDRTMAVSVAEDVFEDALLLFRSDDRIRCGTVTTTTYDRNGLEVIAASPAVFYTATLTCESAKPIVGVREMTVSVNYPGALQPTTLKTVRP